MNKPSISSSMEDYLKTIFELGEQDIKTQVLAAELKLSSASVTGMLKKLSDLKLVDYERYYGVSLTKAGRLIALETLRHHRLIETYLAEALGYPWHELHEEAEKLEHHISEAFEDRIAEALGHPDYDPHGDPIPQKDGSLPAVLGKPLTDFSEGESLVITRVKEQKAEVLKYLSDNKLIPGSRLQIIQKAPFEGPLSLQVAEHSIALAFDLARLIEVEKATSLDKLS